MVPMKLARILALGGTLAAGLWASAPAAWAGSAPAVEDKAVFAPIKSIRYDFGSKSMSGYFVEQAGACHVMLLVHETTDPDMSPPPSAACSSRAVAGSDRRSRQRGSRSLNFTCGEGGRTLLVNAGERDRLVKHQAHPEAVTQ
jgi:hypothetical protein